MTLWKLVDSIDNLVGYFECRNGKAHLFDRYCREVATVSLETTVANAIKIIQSKEQYLA